LIISLDNLTINNAYVSTPTIPESCFNWCKEQHLINASNIDIHTLTIPIIALIILFAWSLFGVFEQYIRKELDINHETYLFYRGTFIVLAQYLLMGFFIWYIWFR